MSKRQTKLQCPVCKGNFWFSNMSRHFTSCARRTCENYTSAELQTRGDSINELCKTRATCTHVFVLQATNTELVAMCTKCALFVHDIPFAPPPEKRARENEEPDEDAEPE